MTDQTTHDVTDDDRRLARKWAEDIVTGVSSARLQAAARVILAAVPAPPRPTLADMTTVERIECQWMQADVGDTGTPAVIVNPCWEDGSARVMWPTTRTVPVSWKNVTPRPDLPRLEWPEATPTGPDHLAVGTVIESADDPRPAALPVGSILLDRDGDTTVKRRRAWTGDGYVPNKGEGDKFGPWTVLHIPKEEA